MSVLNRLEDYGLTTKWLAIITLMIVGVALIFLIMPNKSSRCGDSYCVPGENYMNCPKDCKKPIESNETRIAAARVKVKLFANGDLNLDMSVDGNDTLMFLDARKEFEENGYLKNASLMRRFDIDNDSAVTYEDLECYVEVTDGIYPELGGCNRCKKTSEMEICGDGIDNNCDGQTDRETYDNAAKEPYASDLCSCTSETPCGMSYDAAGIPGSRFVEYCAFFSDSYGWRGQEMICRNEMANTSLSCNSQIYKCVNATGVWVWWNGEYGSWPPV